MPARLVLLFACMLIAGGFGGYGVYLQVQNLNQQPIAQAAHQVNLDLPSTAVTPSSTLTVLPPPVEAVVHVPLPDEVRGIYWTAETVRTKLGQSLIAYMQKYGSNAAVIDLKMDNGEVAIPPQTVIDQLGKDNIYRIARIPVMRDSVYGRAHPDQTIHTASGKSWADKTGSIWLDPSKTAVADNAIDLARKAYAMGFDEVQFDYVRFASDGNLSSIAKTDSEHTKTKEQIMKEFFDRVGAALKKDGIPVSFDLFGVTFLSDNEVGIGQHMKDVYPNADFVSPMAYPSHYWPGYLGYSNPAVHPYEVVKDTLDKGAALLQTLDSLSPTSTRPHFRPWIQDFDIGATYTASMIQAEIKAARDAGASGFLIWNARNVYEPTDYRKH